MPPMPPLRFYSIVLAVVDLPAMRDWYGRVLGFVPRLSGGSAADGTAFVVMDGAGTCIELVAWGEQVAQGQAPPSAPTAPPPSPGPAPTGWTTLDLETDDLAALDAHLRHHGVTIVQSLRILSPRRAMTLIHDPEGNRIAFFGSPPGA